LGQWSRMEEYLKDGQIEIDNNWCEGAMRPIALGCVRNGEVMGRNEWFRNVSVF
jgi:hypothetical protein